MAIKKFTLIEPSVPGLHYTAIVETDGDYEPLDITAFTADRQLYTLKYEGVKGAFPRTDTWDMDIIYTGKGLRDIDYEIVDELASDIHGHRDRPPVKDGM